MKLHRWSKASNLARFYLIYWSFSLQSFIWTYILHLHLHLSEKSSNSKQGTKVTLVNMPQESNSAAKTSAAKNGRRRILQHPTSFVQHKTWRIWYDPITTFDRRILRKIGLLCYHVLSSSASNGTLLAWSVSCWSARPLRQGRLLSG